MGRINLTPLRVRRRALANLETRRTATRPVWLDIVGDIAPAQILIRSQPQQHPPPEFRTKLDDSTLTSPSTIRDTFINPVRQRRFDQRQSNRTRKASKLFQPVEIRYPEDELRRTFYSDHPWELARPRVVLERDRKEGQDGDWSENVEQPERPTTGEDMVQHQLHLLQTSPNLRVSEAYDIARKKFYDVRRKEDIQRRIAAEEAEATGAYFGPSALQLSMQIENKQYDDWEEWSKKTVIEQMQRNAAFAGDTTNVEDDLLEETVEEDNKTGSEVFAAEGARQASQGRRAVA